MNDEKIGIQMKKIIINYKLLKRDLVISNVVAGSAAMVVFVLMLLQRHGIVRNIPCAVHDIFHVYCPGCGGTRALFALLRGQILRSMYYNPALLLGILLIGYYEISVLLTLIKKNGKCYYDRKGWLVYGYVAMLLLFALVRDVLLVYFGIDMIGDFL